MIFHLTASDQLQPHGLLYMLRDNPALLPAAPADYSAVQMDRRAYDEVHPCLRCGDRAECAIIAATDLGPRWLDLCHECVYWLQSQDGNDEQGAP